MAEKKEKEKQLTVEERLKSLYELQTILTEIDRIKTIRGELPLEVKDLEDHIEGLRTRIVNYNNETALARLWCELENPFWFFLTRVCRHYIWKPKVRALLEEARLKQEQNA